jgi:hypothetical protein
MGRTGKRGTTAYRIKLDILKIPPDSATRNFWREWGSAEPDAAAIAGAVEGDGGDPHPEFAFAGVGHRDYRPGKGCT